VQIVDVIKLIRPKEWSKNVFLLLPAFFATKVSLLWQSVRLLEAFIAFCLAASSIYVLNDIMDVKKDRLHPEKSKRPIASGAIRIEVAVVVGLVSLVLSLFLGYESSVNQYIIAYLGVNFLYSIRLKHIPLLDITIISVGFILRVLCGGEASGVFVSKWLILMTFLLSMCLALGKRRDELIVSEHGEKNIRPALVGYNLEFINMGLVFMAVTTVICYIMYSVSEDVVSRLHTDKIYLTSFFVIIGLLRFLQISMVYQKSGSPTNILLKDRFMQWVLVGWALSFSVIIYFRW
jgi:4-hydroxybenzoate polyprenyltransferase